MSDGPHRALPMRPSWKRAAERADNTAFDVAEVTDAISVAVVPDFRADVTVALLAEVQKITNGKQGVLFVDQNLAALEKVKREHAIQPRARDFVDRVMAAISEGKSGLAAVGAAAEQSVRQIVANCIRQIEEFYRRNTKASRTLNVRARLDQAAGRLAVNEIVQRILTPKAARLARKKGLDDGVPF